jgi:hypothetical protein
MGRFPFCERDQDLIWLLRRTRGHRAANKKCGRGDLERVSNAWVDCQAKRDRNEIYGYLSAVYGLVAVWAAEGRRSIEFVGLCG